MLIIRLCLTALAFAVSIQPVQSAVMKAVYTGQLYSIYDETGVFFSPGYNAGYAGGIRQHAYKVVFVYDTSLGVRNTNLGAKYQYDLISGTDSENPVISATLHVNGKTRELAGGVVSSGGASLERVIGRQKRYMFHGFSEIYSDTTVFREYSVSFESFPIGVQINLETPFRHAFPETEWDNFFVISTYDRVASETIEFATAAFLPGRFTLSEYGGPPPPPIPLPATFGLLSLAVAFLIGLRRKRQVA